MTRPSRSEIRKHEAIGPVSTFDGPCEQNCVLWPVCLAPYVTYFVRSFPHILFHQLPRHPQGILECRCMQTRERVVACRTGPCAQELSATRLILMCYAIDKALLAQHLPSSFPLTVVTVFLRCCLDTETLGQLRLSTSPLHSQGASEPFFPLDT